MKELIEVDIKKILPSPTGCALCVGNKDKTFVIYVGPNEGAAILMVLEGIKKTRPLTHDLVCSILKGFGIRVDYVVINELKDNTFYARMVLKEENDIGKNIVEIDGRPSDCIAIAKHFNTKLFVTKEVFEKVEDVSHLMDNQENKDDDFDLFNDKLE
jgi:uncharacterized protein